MGKGESPDLPGGKGAGRRLPGDQQPRMNECSRTWEEFPFTMEENDKKGFLYFPLLQSTII